MNNFRLILYGRKGCCLCDSLEKKLRSIPLRDIAPSFSLDLYIVDIDSPDVSSEDRIRYDLEVPVLFITDQKTNKMIELPRASPRLDEIQLREWLQKIIYKKLEFFH